MQALPDQIAQVTGVITGTLTGAETPLPKATGATISVSETVFADAVWFPFRKTPFKIIPHHIANSRLSGRW